SRSPLPPSLPRRTSRRPYFSPQRLQRRRVGEVFIHLSDLLKRSVPENPPVAPEAEKPSHRPSLSISMLMVDSEPLRLRWELTAHSALPVLFSEDGVILFGSHPELVPQPLPPCIRFAAMI